MDEATLIKNGRGKWGQPGVPHKDWICIEIEDLGEPSRICEMCEHQEIRYVHYMKHVAYPAILKCGCICAGNMEGNLNAASVRDSMMRSRATKRARWLSRKWKLSFKGNPWITIDGYHITIFKKGLGWGASIRAITSDHVIFAQRIFVTSDGAKLSAFDMITVLLAKSSVAR
jgi:hypothetical protein